MDKYNRHYYQTVIDHIKSALESTSPIDQNAIYTEIFGLSQVYRFSDDWEGLQDLEDEVTNLMKEFQERVEKEGGSKVDTEKCDKAVGEILDYQSLVPLPDATFEKNSPEASRVFNKQVVCFLRYLP